MSLEVPLRRDDLVACLERKLGAEHVAGSHDFYRIYDGEGRFLTKAMLSHGRTEVTDREVALVARNLGVPVGMLRDCSDCTAGAAEMMFLIRKKSNPTD